MSKCRALACVGAAGLSSGLLGPSDAAWPSLVAVPLLFLSQACLRDPHSTLEKNLARKAKLEPTQFETRKKLADLFHEPNRQLAELLSCALTH